MSTAAKKSRSGRAKKQPAASNSNSNDSADMHDSDSSDGGAALAAHAEKKQKRLKEARNWLNTLSETDLFNNSLFDEKHVAELKQQFAAHKPFPLLRLSEFMDSDYLTRVKDELKKLDYFQKNNDLYEFAQR